MPNYVYNTVKFDAKDVDRVWALVHNGEQGFDFNQIIPMPESLHIVSGSCTSDAWDYLRGKDMSKRYPDEGEAPDPSYFWTPDKSSPWKSAPTPKTLPELKVYADVVKANKTLYGSTDWYDWSCKHWGTKWNACDAEWGCTTVRFDTAWSDPEPIFIALSKMLGIRFVVSCEEEGLSFCSISVYDNGEKTDEEVAEGLAGLALLGNSREDIIERYKDWYDDEEMQRLCSELDELGIM